MIKQQKWQRVDSNRRPKAYEAVDPLQLLNSLSVTEISELSNFSKSYISQVKHGKGPSSRKLLQVLQDFKAQRKRHTNLEPYQAIQLFLKSRRDGLSLGTIAFYERVSIKGYL